MKNLSVVLLFALFISACQDELVFPPVMPEGNVLRVYTTQGGQVTVSDASAELGKCSKYEFSSECYRFDAAADSVLTPVADPGFEFVGFTGACKDQNPCNLTVNGNKTVTAKFQHTDYDFSQVMPTLQAYLSSHKQFKGAGITIVHKDKGVLYENVTGNQFLDSVALVASVSKVPAAGILMSLIDEGRFGRDRPIENLTGWDPVRPGMTVEHALSNTSGLPGLLTHSVPGGIYAPHLCSFVTFDKLLSCARWIFQHDWVGDYVNPGSVFQYGGAQWQIAGAVAEVRGKNSWANLVKTRLVEPCDLTVLRYGFNDTKKYTGHPDSLVATENPYIEAGAIGNIHDFGQILLMHLNDGMCGSNQVMSAESAAEMRVDRGTPAGKHPTRRLGGSGHWSFPSGYGMGWWIKLEEDGSEPHVFYDAGSYGSLLMFDTELDYGIYIQLEDYRFPPDPNAIEPSVEDLINDFQPLMESIFGS